MDETFIDGDSLAILKRLVTDIGTPQLLSLIADVVEEHANALIQQGKIPQAARCGREVRVLREASQAIVDY